MSARTREETAVKFADVVTLPPGVRVPEADASLPDALAFVGEVASALGIREFAIESPTYSKRDVMFRVTLWGDDAESGDVGDAPDLSHAAMLAAIEAKRGAAVSETKPPTQLDVERARKWLSSPMSNDMGPREFCALVNHVRVLLAALDAAEARADAAGIDRWVEDARLGLHVGDEVSWFENHRGGTSERIGKVVGFDWHGSSFGSDTINKPWLVVNVHVEGRQRSRGFPVEEIALIRSAKEAPRG